MSHLIRLIVAALTLAVAFTLAPADADSVPSVALRAVTEPETHPIRVGTYNIRADRSLTDFISGVDRFKNRVDVAGLQEINTAEKNYHLLDDEGWGYFRPEDLRQIPVIWNNDVFDLVSAHQHLLAEGRYVGDEKPGADTYRQDSYAAVVRLQHRVTGQPISVINVHLVSGAVRLGEPYPGRPRLFDLYVEQVQSTKAVTEAEKAWGRVFVVGDFNVSYRADAELRHADLPYATFTAKRMKSMWRNRPLDGKGGTFGPVFLDGVWTTGKKADKAVVVRKIKISDHYPAIATYHLTAGS